MISRDSHIAVILLLTHLFTCIGDYYCKESLLSRWVETAFGCNSESYKWRNTSLASRRQTKQPADLYDDE